jgi:hypothetical protein
MIEIEKIELTNISGVMYRIKGTNLLHREDGPAIETIYEGKTWYSHGRVHREGGPAIEHVDGTKEWYKHGFRHRVDGPAIILKDGTEKWFLNGYLHRDDGPAITKKDGHEAWFLNDILFKTKEEWFEELTEEQKEKALYSEYFIKG